MREFDVDKYLGNSFFRGLIEKVYNAKEGNDLMNALTELDRFVSKECEIAPIRMVYEKIEEYAVEIMEKNGYWFDYSEYSRQNWAIMKYVKMFMPYIRLKL